MSSLVFCENCDNMLYLKEGKEVNTLKYHCRNCGEESNSDIQNRCVYDIKYKQDDYAYKYSNNTQLINDPTLPRMKNIKCINPECVTNKFKKRFFNIRTNDDSKLNIDSLINEIDENVDIGDDNDILYGMNSDKSRCLSLEVDKEEVEEDEEGEDYLSNVVNYLKQKENLEVSEIQNVSRNVIFIKYDKLNMKYIFICTNCNTSWKNK